MLTFEQFIEETWDYVSERVVSDDFWFNNNEMIRELTYDLYLIYKKNVKEVEPNVFAYRFTPKDFGKILEIQFSIMNKFRPNFD